MKNRLIIYTLILCSLVCPVHAQSIQTENSSSPWAIMPVSRQKVVTMHVFSQSEKTLDLSISVLATVNVQDNSVMSAQIDSIVPYGTGGFLYLSACQSTVRLNIPSNGQVEITVSANAVYTSGNVSFSDTVNVRMG